MSRRRAILALLAGAVVLAVAIIATNGDPGNRKSSPETQVVPTGLPPLRSTGPTGSQPDPQAIRHPHVSAQVRTHPRLQPHLGGRNTTFTLSFRRRRDLGPHGRVWSYYGVIVSPLTRNPHHGCYGFGRYVMRGSKGEVASVPIHPRKRLWCKGEYQVAVYLTGRPRCPPSRQPHPCSTASYKAIPTGWAYFAVQ